MGLTRENSKLMKNKSFIKKIKCWHHRGDETENLLKQHQRCVEGLKPQRAIYTYIQTVTRHSTLIIRSNNPTNQQCRLLDRLLRERDTSARVLAQRAAHRSVTSHTVGICTWIYQHLTKKLMCEPAGPQQERQRTYPFDPALIANSLSSHKIITG